MPNVIFGYLLLTFCPQNKERLEATNNGPSIEGCGSNKLQRHLTAFQIFPHPGKVVILVLKMAPQKVDGVYLHRKAGTQSALAVPPRQDRLCSRQACCSLPTALYIQPLGATTAHANTGETHILQDDTRCSVSLFRLLEALTKGKPP